MLKQGVKTINTEFIRTYALSQLSFVQFRPYATLFVGLVLPLMLMSKSKETLETRLDLMPMFKTSIDCWCKGWGSYFECGLFGIFGTVILFKAIMAEKDVCCMQTLLSPDCNFSFCTYFLHCWWLLKVKKRINKALSKQSKQFLLLCYFFI